MSKIDERLRELGISLPEGPAPMANYVPAQRDGSTLYFSGAGPLKDGKPTVTGRLGEDLGVEQGYQAAREAAINLIASLKREIGDLDKVEQVVKVVGYVSSSPDFFSQPAVINGASDLLVAVFGDRGRHARTAIGTSVLPFRLPVEVEMIVRVRE
jgi:enamine deaminase RidA (YjgF/YER057c/UK114 family)